MEKIELFAVKYGTSTYASANVFDKDTTKRMIPFSWMFFVIKADDHIILVDTGFSDPGLTSKFRITRSDIGNSLRQIGVPYYGKIDIIITHPHFDHAGDIQLFPNSRVITHIKNKADLKQYFNKNQMVEYFDNAYTLYNCITVQHIGGHSEGSSVVRINTGTAAILITGDEAYVPENYTLHIPVGLLHNRKANLDFLNSIDPKKETPYTLHDPLLVPEGKTVFKLYP